MQKSDSSHISTEDFSSYYIQLKEVAGPLVCRLEVRPVCRQSTGELYVYDAASKRVGQPSEVCPAPLTRKRSAILSFS